MRSRTLIFTLVLLAVLCGRAWGAPPYTTNLNLYLDAGNTSAFGTSGSAVTSWPDLSGNGQNAALYSGSTSPLVEQSVFGSHNVVRFGGNSTDGLKGALSNSITGGTLYIALNCTGSNAANGAVISCTTAAGNDQSTGGLGLYVPSGSPTGGPLYTIVGGEPVGYQNSGAMVICLSASNYGGSSTYTGWINGTEVSRYVTSCGTIMADYVLGQRWQSGAASTTLGAKVDIAMVLVYNELSSAANIQAVSLWMMGQCGTTNPGTGGTLNLNGTVLSNAFSFTVNGGTAATATLANPVAWNTGTLVGSCSAGLASFSSTPGGAGPTYYPSSGSIAVGANTYVFIQGFIDFLPKPKETSLTTLLAVDEYHAAASEAAVRPVYRVPVKRQRQIVPWEQAIIVERKRQER
jgi:hypothetical protein